MIAIFRQAAGVIVGGLIVAGFTLAPRVSANDEITVASLNTPVAMVEPAATDKRMPYQGMLLNSNGNPVNKTVSMTFKLYNSNSESASPLWAYAFDAVQDNGVKVTNGMFTVLLPVGKDGNSEAIFSGQNLFLGIAIDGDPEARPRQPMLYVPYAHWARNADELGGKGSQWLPFAYGVIDRETGGIVKGSGNFDATWRDEDDRKYYEVRFHNVVYNLNEYVTIVTPISQKECPNPTVAHTNSNSSDGTLIIDLKDGNNGAITKCKFHFVTFKL